MGISIVVTSGKGGTGKTAVLSGTASALAAMGRRVLCVDLDIGLRSLDMTLGMSDRVLMDFSDVIEQRCTLEQAAVEHPQVPGLYLLTAPVNASASWFQQEDIAALVDQAREQFDFCLIDSPGGIDAGFRLATCGADRAIVVSTTEPASLRAAQKAVSLLQSQEIPIHLVVNKLSRRLLRQLHTTIDDAMDTAGLPLLGVIPDDRQVSVCGGRGLPLSLSKRSGAPTACRNIARRLLGQHVPLARFSLLEGF